MLLIILCAIIGLLLVFLEFFLPGMIFAVGGAILLLISMSLFCLAYPVMWGIGFILFLLLMLFLVCKVALRWIVRSKTDLTKDQEGYVAAQFEKTAIGKCGVALTDLKPSGHVVVDGKPHQALCETGYVASGAFISVIGGKGGHLIVQKE
jgi:membrane-bound serine protease (ClpP class)